jgi:hypothetical protein
VDVEVLNHAAQVKFRSCGKRRFPSPERHQYVTEAGHQIQKSIRYASAGRKSKKMTTVSALTTLVEAGLSRKQYEVIRSTHTHTHTHTYIYIYIYIYMYIATAVL